MSENRPSPRDAVARARAVAAPKVAKAVDAAGPKMAKAVDAAGPKVEKAAASAGKLLGSLQRRAKESVKEFTDALGDDEKPATRRRPRPGPGGAPR